LENAIVEATPIGCAPLATALPPPLSARTALSTPWCQPRTFDAITRGDGSFALDLDPGDYSVVVRPQVGSRLPWVSWKSIQVEATGFGSPLGIATVPAPMFVGLQLTDSFGPISNALVRIFRVFQSSSVELGQAITGKDGRYEMYVVPP
jgi:hypothetical protein